MDNKMSENTDNLHNDISVAVYKSKEMLHKKLSAHEIWVKVNHEKLSDKDHKKLLVDNGIIVPKQKEISKS
jgi:hypothetical protein